MQAQAPCWWHIHGCHSTWTSVFFCFVPSDCAEVLRGIRVQYRVFFSVYDMQDLARSGVAGKVTAPWDVGFKCSNCNGEFVPLARHAKDCYHRHAKYKLLHSKGTPFANPSSSKSLSFAARADMSTGILRHHDGANIPPHFLQILQVSILGMSIICITKTWY